MNRKQTKVGGKHAFDKKRETKKNTLESTLL